MSRCKTADNRRPKYRRIQRREEFRLGESIFVLDKNPIWMTRLQILRLAETGITDAGLEHLKGLANLRYLYLSETQTTDAGVQRLEQSLPKLIVR
jgi:hypothetical protein